ncbi:MAG: glycyl-radical enzyme activating protein [Oscillospiraceae bacterium]|nr:glycyl-radical enzyme activating protein [Oscillospiraceae bacterium]
MNGLVFNVERGSSEDGPGIRTVVFLKGCGLRCRWCANPESKSGRPEILYIANVCVQCGECVRACSAGAVTFREGYGFISDMDKCVLCGECIRHCYVNARKLQGEEYTPEALTKELLKDEAFFRQSGGGVTFSGGEPLLQADFLCETADLLHREGVRSLIETCGFAPAESVRKAAEHVDAIFYDFKHADSERHRALTGQDNRRILENLAWLMDNFRGDLSVRYPYIPGCNDDEGAIRGFLEFMSRQERKAEIVFLPYHRLGLPKYIGLGRDYGMGDMKSLKREALEHIRPWAADYGLQITIQ